MLLVTGSAEAASFPPGLRFRSIVTPRVTVHFHQGLEGMARQAAALAGEILAAHEARYGWSRVPRVHVVLADVEDDPNGFATPLPFPLVSLRAVAPNGADEFGNYEDWLRLLLTHELAHVVHLDQGRGFFGFSRRLFGRNPLLFPNVLAPIWMVEGLATYEETEGTAFGRGRDPDSRMVVRMAALEGEFPEEDRASPYTPDRWPIGHTPYLFGEAFLRNVTHRSGTSAIPDLARMQSGRVPFLDDLTAQKATGFSVHNHWKLWSGEAGSEFQAEAARVEARGVTASRPLTSRGVRQRGPRFSPDGTWIAYTSHSLTRFPAIRLVRPDGSGDRQLARRNGGTSLSWTPDARSIVFDEAEVVRFFSRRYDLRAVDVVSGRVRPLTRGLRAREPDVSPDGRTVVFVRQMGDRGELFTIGLDGRDLRPLTWSAPGTQWGSPRFSPDGDRVAASRWTSGGWLDVVEVDVASGEVVNLTRDRAKDLEPTWTPDGAFVVFRSDRDGISNLYALRRADRALLRLSNVVGGAFTPAVSPSGREIVFSSYSARGYDVHLTSLDIGSAPSAEPFVDAHPPPRASPVGAIGAATSYRSLPAVLPRFWSPIVISRDRETQVGAGTAGVDPLFRHFYALDLSWGTASERLSARGLYQYDRLWPTFLFTGEDSTDVQEEGSTRTRRLNVRATFPVQRTIRSSQSVSLTWRRERERVAGPERDAVDLGGIEVAWSLSTVKQFARSFSPVDGSQLRAAYLKEDPALGSDVSLSKVVAEGRTYWRLAGETDVIALRLAGGTTFGEPGFTRSFAVGGFPDSELFDLVRTNVAVLRGYPDDAFTGRSFASGSLEYRLPLAFVERGWRSVPIFLRRLHGAVFFDAGHAWSGGLRLREVKTAAGAAIGIDTYLGHGLGVTGTVSVARGLADRGETRAYFRLGLAF
jgi:Tol biopolymer transport system component